MSNIVFALSPENNAALNELCGPLDENLHLIENKLNIHIKRQNFKFEVAEDLLGEKLKNFITKLYADILRNNLELTEQVLYDLLHDFGKPTTESSKTTSNDKKSKTEFIKTSNTTLKLRNYNQVSYINCIHEHDVTFGIGPAGTGKTFLAVAAAVEALERKEIKRILLVRPAIEAGEKLGFLPGDISQKVDPYLRPLYDALFEFLGFEKVENFIKKSIIELAPLAYMRGRTLDDAFIILDESQNTTHEQMQMFLTRIGFNSKVVITGDLTQIDLPRGVTSGLKNAVELLNDIDEIAIHKFNKDDIVRHPVIAEIVSRYEKYAKELKQRKHDRE